MQDSNGSKGMDGKTDGSTPKGPNRRKRRALARQDQDDISAQKPRRLFRPKPSTPCTPPPRSSKGRGNEKDSTSSRGSGANKLDDDDKSMLQALDEGLLEVAPKNFSKSLAGIKFLIISLPDSPD